MLNVDTKRDVQNLILNLHGVLIHDDEHVDVRIRLIFTCGLRTEEFTSSKFFPRADRKLRKNSSSAAASLDFSFTRLVIFDLPGGAILQRPAHPYLIGVDF
jgi:hypothetical protein